ncbi:hypothetical protein [Devosia riboflavina]
MTGFSVELAAGVALPAQKSIADFALFQCSQAPFYAFEANLLLSGHQILPGKSDHRGRLTVSLRPAFWQNPSR